MPRRTRDKIQLLLRVKRIKGQLQAVERQIEEEEDCSTLLQTVAGARGAFNGLIAEIIESHIRERVADPDRKPRNDKARAAQTLIDVVRTYLR